MYQQQGQFLLDDLIYCFYHFQRSVGNELEKKGATSHSAKLLIELRKYKRKGMRQSEIVQFLETSSSGVTRMLERMSKEGLLLRFVDKYDRRMNRIVITEKGIKMSNDVFQTLIRMEHAFIDSFDSSEIDMIFKACSMIGYVCKNKIRNESA